VGVPEYTPPELHGKNFTTLDRTANHDLFGLSVLVFHLLMMGRHPFSGVPLVPADIPIEKAIQEGLYAYTRNPTRLKPPPNVPPLAMLDAATIDLFERAFGSSQRPTATEWRNSLDASMKHLARCKNDPKHSYPAAAGKCPWCQLIAVARLMFFTPGQGASGAPFRPEDIDDLIRRLAGMQIAFPPYARPRATLPIQVSLPPGLQSVRKPVLLPHPAPPAPVQKPVLAPLPPPPALLPRPPIRHLPVQPQIPPSPALKPHPPAPVDAPCPKLHSVPLPPVDPRMPTLGPPDPFLPRLCIAGIIGGACVFFVAKLVGVIAIAAFAVWWFLLNATENRRRERAREGLKEAHEDECERMDEEYAEACRPIEEANERILDAWKSANGAKAKEHARQCRAVDEENRRRLAPWALVKAAIEADHEQARKEVEGANRRVLSAWETENASRQWAYDKGRGEIEQDNYRLTSAWEALTASRQADHERACGVIDAKNRRLVADWEAANAPWLAEERRWRDRVMSAEAEVVRLEAEIDAQRSASTARFRQRKDEANGIVASHNHARQDYDKELRQAEIDSKNIQMEAHLENSLIRHAKLRGITGDRVLALESFGIETAYDVYKLQNQKVPGIGPVLSARLFEWRDKLASSFVPKQTLPESEKNRIASRYAPVLLPLGQSIQGAIDELDVIAGSHRAREADQVRAIGAAVQNMAFAEAHVRVMRVR